MGVRVREKEKGSGEWWVFINCNGKRKAKKVGDKKTAIEVGRKIEARLVLGEFHFEEEEIKETLSGYAHRWLDSYAKTACKDTSYREYESILRIHLLPVFGSKPLAEITREQVKQLAYGKLKTGLSPRRVQYIIRTLSVIFNHALEDGLVKTNPAARPGKFLKLKRHPSKEINPFTREEVILMLETARGYFPRYYPLLLCAVRTGLRLGELLALQWGDLDFHSRFIEVRRNYTHGKLTTPKSNKIRKVDMSRQLAETLLALKLERKKETLAKGWKEGPPWLFVNEKGNLLDGRNLRERVFYRCLEKAGLRRIRFHDLRHTFASLLIQQGESLAYIRDQLGHQSIQITVDTYGHLIPGANREAVDKLDDATYMQPKIKSGGITSR